MSRQSGETTATDAPPFDLAATLRRAREMGIDPARVLVALGLRAGVPDEESSPER